MSLDYTKFSQDGKDTSTSAKPEVNNKKWWTLEDEECAGSVTGIINLLSRDQSALATQRARSAQLYGNMSRSSFGGFAGISRTGTGFMQYGNKITYNVVQSAIDTVTSKIAKNKPKPLFVTQGGDYKIQRRAQKLNEFVDGIFYENNAYTLGTEVFRDACVYGTGVVHVFSQYGRVKFERVLPSELYVDEQEAFYGEPRQIHRLKIVDRELLLDLFPEKKELIESTNAAIPPHFVGKANIADQIAVRESWHLKSGPDAEDGKHVISIDNGTLLEEEYDKDCFPFAFFHWNKRLHGYWGQGLAEQIQSIQLEINKLLMLVQKSMHLAGSFKIFIENGSKIVKEHLNNEVGTLVNYTGTKPEYVVAPIVPPEIYSQIDRLKNSAFEQAGISQLSAASKKPDGLNSGKALREFNDIETDRFMTVGQAYEKLFLDIAKIAIGVAKDIYSTEGKFSVTSVGSNFIKSISWKDVKLQEDEYKMKAYPVSSLPNDPAGRLQTIQEYIQAGFISPRQGRRLLDFPDLDQAENLANAAENYLHTILEKIVDDGDYTPPEPYDDLALARELALQYYQMGKYNSLEDEKLELLRRFLDQLDALNAQAQGPAPGAQPTPQANPQPAPTSDLVQNVPGQAA